MLLYAHQQTIYDYIIIILCLCIQYIHTTQALGQQLRVYILYRHVTFI